MSRSKFAVLAAVFFAADDGTQSAVNSMAAHSRTAVILHYYNGMPVNALSKFLGVSESTASAVLGKARADILEDEDENEDC